MAVSIESSFLNDMSNIQDFEEHMVVEQVSQIVESIQEFDHQYSTNQH